MIRPRLLLAITLIIGVTASNAWLSMAAQKQNPPPKSGWAASEAPAVINDPAYAAYDAGDYALAMRLATEAAARGEHQADTLIGDMYEQAFGVKQDYIKAAEWFTKGAVAGDMHA
ncbi:MAG: hypothetical protein WBS14_05960, partial [Rhodomicrobium sp.]